MKKYELKQNGKRYILSSQIFNDKLRFACIDYSNEPEKIYIAEYVINDKEFKDIMVIYYINLKPDCRKEYTIDYATRLL